MKEKFEEDPTFYKECAMEMSGSIIGLSLSQSLLGGKNSEEDNDIAHIMEYLSWYDDAGHYIEPCWSSSYYFFKYYNLPITLKIIKNAAKKGKLTRKWIPCLELFIDKTKDFLSVIPEGYDDYLKSLEDSKK